MNKIVSKIYGHGRGWAFSPNDFNGMANRDTIRQALFRLVKSGTIRRVIRGIYDYPRKNKFGGGLLGPNPEQVAAAIARKYKWNIQPEGNTALNMLGLSTQIVAHYIYTSDGPSRVFKWGDRSKVTFRHTRKRDVSALSPKTVLVVLALKTLGKIHVTKRVIDNLRDTLTDGEKAMILREARYVTGWVYDSILEICGRSSNA